MLCVSGLASSLTALTKQRRPSLVVSLAASPGEKPPGWVTARTTLPPMRSSIADRTPAGSCSQWTRIPSAGGGLDEDTSAQLQVVVDAFLDRVADLVGNGHDQVLVVGRLRRVRLGVDHGVKLDPPLARHRDHAQESQP